METEPIFLTGSPAGSRFPPLRRRRKSHVWKTTWSPSCPPSPSRLLYFLCSLLYKQQWTDALESLLMAPDLTQTHICTAVCSRWKLPLSCFPSVFILTPLSGGNMQSAVWGRANGRLGKSKQHTLRGFPGGAASLWLLLIFVYKEDDIRWSLAFTCF